MSTPASAAVIVARSRRSPWMNSALGFSHAGFPRRCVCGSRLSRARTVQPWLTRRSTTCEPIRPAPPLTNARFAMIACSGGVRPPQISAHRAPLQFFPCREVCQKFPGVRRDIVLSRIKQQFVTQTVQARAIINIISRGQKFYFQPDLSCALYRLIEHAFRAPIDLLEQVLIQLLHSNQVIPSIVARTEHNAVLADA